MIIQLSQSTRNFSFVVIGRVGNGILQGVFYMIFALLLTPHQYGELSYLIALAGVVSVIARFGFNHSVLVFLSKQNEKIVNQINLLVLITSSIAAILLLPFNIYASILSLGLSFFSMSQHYLLGNKNYKFFMLTAFLKGSFTIIIPLILYNFLLLDGIILGLAIGNLCVSFPYLKKIKFVLIKNQIKSNLPIFLNNFGVDASIHFTRTIDKIIIVPILGFVSTGIYQFNLQILFGLEMLPLAFHSFFLSEESSQKRHLKIEILSMILSVVVVLIVIFLSPILIPSWFPEYQEGVPGLQIMILSLIPLTFASIYTAKLQSISSKLIGISAFVRIITLIVLIVTIGHSLGLIGLAYAVLISNIAYSCYIWFLYRKKTTKSKR